MTKRDKNCIDCKVGSIKLKRQDALINSVLTFTNSNIISSVRLLPLVLFSEAVGISKRKESYVKQILVVPIGLVLCIGEQA